MLSIINFTILLLSCLALIVLAGVLFVGSIRSPLLLIDNRIFRIEMFSKGKVKINGTILPFIGWIKNNKYREVFKDYSKEELDQLGNLLFTTHLYMYQTSPAEEINKLEMEEKDGTFGQGFYFSTEVEVPEIETTIYKAKKTSRKKSTAVKPKSNSKGKKK